MKVEQLNEGVLCQLKVSRWGAYTKLSKDKLGPDVPSEIVRGVQDLVDDRTIIDDLLAVKRATKRELLNSSMPFPVDGVFWVPKHKIEYLDKVFTELKAEYAELTDKLVKKMGSLKRSFKTKYPEYYDETNYPSADSIRAKHDFFWRFFQFQLPDKDAGILTASMYKREREKFQSMANEMEMMAVNIIGSTLLARIEKLKEQCDNDKINAGTINALDKFLGKWDDLWKDNIDGKKMKSIMRSLRIQMKKTSADKLRNSEDFRGEVSKKMEKIAKQIKAVPDFKVKRKLDV